MIQNNNNSNNMAHDQIFVKISLEAVAYIQQLFLYFMSLWVKCMAIKYDSAVFAIGRHSVTNIIYQETANSFMISWQKAIITNYLLLP